MFDVISSKFDEMFKRIRGEARLTEENIKDALRDVRMALLDADVNFKVVKDFIKAVREAAIGQETVKGVLPAQQIIKIVNDELVKMLGSETAEFTLPDGKMKVILLLGLQGSGKTTFSGKLSHWCMTKFNSKPLLIAADIYRPAAIKQLHVVGETIGVPVFDMGTETPAPEIVKKGIEHAKATGRDLVIIDTAGRLHIDEVKMDELTEVKKIANPDYAFLVADAMTGQDAVNSANTFHEGIGINGVCLTKIDGDARGGAALSIRAVTGKPVYFIGTGEKPRDLEQFHPDRIASRILGMGDVVSLVEMAQEQIDEDEAAVMQKKLKRSEFDLQDFLDYTKKIKKMGSLSSLMKRIPGMGQMVDQMDVSDDMLKPMESMILSMTPEERRNPDVLDGSRRKRIAQGAGRTAQEINMMLKEFQQTRQMMSMMMQAGGPGAMAGNKGGRMARPAAGETGIATKTKPKHRRKQNSKKNKKKRKSR